MLSRFDLSRPIAVIDPVILSRECNGRAMSPIRCRSEGGGHQRRRGRSEYGTIISFRERSVSPHLAPPLPPPRIGTWCERGDLFAIAAPHLARDVPPDTTFLIENVCMSCIVCETSRTVGPLYTGCLLHGKAWKTWNFQVFLLYLEIIRELSWNFIENLKKIVNYMFKTYLKYIYVFICI